MLSNKTTESANMIVANPPSSAARLRGAIIDQEQLVPLRGRAGDINITKNYSTVGGSAHPQRYLFERWLPSALELTEMFENDHQQTEGKIIKARGQKPPALRDQASWVHQPYAEQEPQLNFATCLNSQSSVTSPLVFVSLALSTASSSPIQQRQEERGHGPRVEELAKQHATNQDITELKPSYLSCMNDQYRHVSMLRYRQKRLPYEATAADLRDFVGCEPPMTPCRKHPPELLSLAEARSGFEVTTASNAPFCGVTEHEGGHSSTKNERTHVTRTKQRNLAFTAPKPTPRPARARRGGVREWCNPDARSQAFKYDVGDPVNYAEKRKWREEVIDHARVEDSATSRTSMTNTSVIKQSKWTVEEMSKNTEVAQRVPSIPELKCLAGKSESNEPKSRYRSRKETRKEETIAAVVRRPLTAYNFFFLDERDHLLNEDESSCRLPSYYSSAERKAEILSTLWNRDRTAKRIHRKTHGKVKFVTLSRTISQRWKDLKDECRQFYTDLASKDRLRYKVEMNKMKCIGS